MEGPIIQGVLRSPPSFDCDPDEWGLAGVRLKSAAPRLSPAAPDCSPKGFPKKREREPLTQM